MSQPNHLLSLEWFSKGGGGTIGVTTTTANTTKGYMIRVDSDAVFEHIQINGNTDDVRASYLDSTGATLDAGTFIVAGEMNMFTSVKLTSGKITIFKLTSNYQ